MKALKVWVMMGSLIVSSLSLDAQNELRLSQNGKSISGLEFNAKDNNGVQNVENQIPIRQNSLKSSTCDDVLFFEGFDDPEYIPIDFINLDVDANTDANGRPSDWFVSSTYETFLGDTNFAASASSWFSPAGQANNWLITPAINVCDVGYELEWKSAPIEGPAYMDGYKVLISVTDGQMASFTDTLAVFAEDITGFGVLFAKGIPHTSFIGSSGLLQRWYFALDAYVGQNIRVAFVHDSNDDNLLYVDDITVRKALDFDLDLLSFQSNLEYGLSPINHVKTIGDFVAEVHNNALTPVTDVEVEVEITGVASGQVFIATGGLSTILATVSEQVAVAGSYLPDVIDDFTITAELAAGVVKNNQEAGYTRDFAVSDSVYARDNGSVDGSLSIGLGSTGILGQQYELLEGDVLSSVSFHRLNPTLGDSLRVLVYSLEDGLPSLLLGQSEWLVETSDLEGLRTVGLLGGPLSLAEGAFVLALEEALNTRAELAVNNEMYLPEVTHVLFDGVWYHNEDFGFLSVYVLQANLGSACAEPLAAFDYQLAGGALTLNNGSAVSNEATYLWDFGDGETSTLENPTHEYAANGLYYVYLTITDLCGADTKCSEVQVSQVSIDENSTAVITLFPNPSSSRVDLILKNVDQKNALQVLNALGQIVYSVDLSNGQANIAIDVSQWSDGIYFVQTQSGIMQRLVVQH